MKNKALIIIIGIVTILLVVLLGIRYNFSGNAGKLKSSINYPTTNGLAFSCDTTTITVGSEATCTLVGYWTGGVRGISSQVSVSNGLELVKITDVSPWKNMDIEPVLNSLYMSNDGGSSSDQFTIAEVKVKGVATGSQTLSLVPYDSEPSIYVQTRQNPDEVIDTNNSVPNVNQAITVTNSSGGGDTPTESSVKTLETLTVSEGTLSPAFNKNVNDYSVIVPNEISQITVDGTKTDSNSSVSGFTTYDLPEGNKQITITVTAQDRTTNQYNITVTRQGAIDPTKSSDNTLKGLTIKGATLVPTFSSSVDEYTVTVENSVTKVEIEATPNDSKATVSIPDSVNNLQVGNNTIVINVTAENNEIKTYTIVVNRKSSGSDTCVLQLTSVAYKVDNTKQTIDVNRDDTVDTIKKNLSFACGTISVTADKVVLSNGNDTKTYTINRVFVPNTGQNPIMYVAIIAGIVLVIGILIFVKKKMDK